MKRIGLLALFLSACTATTYPYASQPPPQYASTQTTQTTQASDGSSTVTSTTTETQTTEAYPAAQPAVYEAQPADAPPPPPPAPASDSTCSPKDTPEMCVSLHVILDVGAIVKNSEGGSCRDASKALNRYADAHRHELETFLSLEQSTSKKQLEKFQKRHQSEATVVMTGAMDLDQRCQGDEKLDRAFKRVGFTGLIGN